MNTPLNTTEEELKKDIQAMMDVMGPYVVAIRKKYRIDIQLAIVTLDQALERNMKTGNFKIADMDMKKLL